MPAPVNRFTKEQMEILRKNPYVLAINEKQIRFTKEFKQTFCILYTKDGMRPKEIFEKLGFDYRMLGERRIWGISEKIRKEFSSNDGFSRDALAPRTRQSDESGLRDEINRLRSEVDYLKQEQSSLKSIILELLEKKGEA